MDPRVKAIVAVAAVGEVWLRLQAKAFDEEQHPRDEHGRWASGGSHESLKEARQWATDHSVPTVPANEKQAAESMVQALIRTDPKVAESEELQAKIRKNWTKELKGRVASVDPAHSLAVQNAINANFSDPTFRDIVEQHGQENVVFAKPEPGANARAGERIGATTFIYDDTLMSSVKSESPKPGDVTSGEANGLAAEMRHEYGHYLWGKRLPDEVKDQFHKELPESGQVKTGLTHYAAKNHEEAFCELFATVTGPKYDRAAFPKWVQSQGAAILGALAK